MTSKEDQERFEQFHRTEIERISKPPIKEQLNYYKSISYWKNGELVSHQDRHRFTSHPETKGGEFIRVLRAKKGRFFHCKGEPLLSKAISLTKLSGDPSSFLNSEENYLMEMGQIREYQFQQAGKGISEEYGSPADAAHYREKNGGRLIYKKAPWSEDADQAARTLRTARITLENQFNGEIPQEALEALEMAYKAGFLACEVASFDSFEMAERGRKFVYQKGRSKGAGSPLKSWQKEALSYEDKNPEATFSDLLHHLESCGVATPTKDKWLMNGSDVPLLEESIRKALKRCRKKT